MLYSNDLLTPEESSALSETETQDKYIHDLVT